MKRKTFGTIVAIAAMCAGYSAYEAQNERTLSDAVLNNVEAIAQTENKVGYNCMHFVCYKTVNYGGKIELVPTGEYRATSWEVEGSSKSKHDHGCSSCNSY